MTEINSPEPEQPEQIGATVDSLTQWLAEQDPRGFENTIERAWNRHDELMKKGSDITPAETREMAEIQDVMLSLMRINDRLSQTDE